MFSFTIHLYLQKKDENGPSADPDQTAPKTVPSGFALCLYLSVPALNDFYGSFKYDLPYKYALECMFD